MNAKILSVTLVLVGLFGSAILNQVVSESVGNDNKGKTKTSSTNEQHPGPRTPYVKEGSVGCMDLMSLIKATMIQRTNNPYARLPDECAMVPNNNPVRILRHLDAGGTGNAVLVTNNVITYYVNTRDVAF